MDRRSRQPLGLMIRLCCADLLHEWILTLCAILGVAAVSAPLLILYGLKSGTIQTLRQRLIHDPRNCEIRPLVSKTYSAELLHEIKSIKGVGFMVPATREISTSVQAHLSERTEIETLDLIPTEAGDPLIKGNGSAEPQSGQCVLTFLAAESLRAKVGDTVVCDISRTRRGAMEKATTQVVVAGILPVRASGTKAVYTPLSLLEAVEAYKDGLAVPEFAWPGSSPEAYPVYDGVLVISQATIAKTDLLGLTGSTGFFSIRDISPAELPGVAGFKVGDDKCEIHLLQSGSQPVGEDSITTIRNKLGGYKAVVLPWNKAFNAELRSGGAGSGKTIKLFPITFPREMKGITISPQLGGPLAGEQGSGTDPEVWCPPPLVSSNSTLIVKFGDEATPLVAPVRVTAQEGLPAGSALITASMGGILRLAKMRDVHYDSQAHKFLVKRSGFASFRLYAKTIDDVDRVRLALAARNIQVMTQAQKIADVREMDKNLTLLYWLITTVAVIGGLASLAASLYASVERKRKALGILQLVGLKTALLLRFPIYEAFFVSTAGFLCGAAASEGIGGVINRLFGKHLEHGEAFFLLPFKGLVYSWIAVSGIALCASLVAAIRLVNIQAADSLRDE